MNLCSPRGGDVECQHELAEVDCAAPIRIKSTENDF